MPCVICGANQSDYACESCKRLVCYSHVRTAGKSVMCIECLKNAKPVKEKNNFLESAFTYSLVLTTGLAVIFFVGEYAVSGLMETYSGLLPDTAKNLVSLLRGASVMLLLGSVAITVLLFLAGRLADRKPPGSPRNRSKDDSHQ